MNLFIDKEFEALIPPLTEEEFSGLKESVLNEGCRDAIVVWNGTIVDGHNRYRICKENSIPFTVEEKDFESRDDAIIWIIKNQFGRRNLPAYERARLALRLKPVIAEKAKERQGTRTDLHNIVPNSAQSRTRDELARSAGVGHDTIAKVEKIEAFAPEEVKEQLRSGEMSINQAYKTLKAFGIWKKETPTSKGYVIPRKWLEDESSAGYCYCLERITFGKDGVQ